MEMPNREQLGIKYWWPVSESNQGHADFQSAALPTELTGQEGSIIAVITLKSMVSIVQRGLSLSEGRESDGV